MTDCCQDISSRLSALESAITNIPRVNEGDILNKALAQAKALFPVLVPGIAAPIAIGLINPIKNKLDFVEATAESAGGKAAQAEGEAAAAGGKATTALANIASLALQLASVLISLGTLYSLSNRMDALERELDGVREDASRAMSTAVQGVLAARQANVKAEIANKLANQADQHAGFVESIAIRAETTAQKAQATANEGLRQARLAISFSTEAISRIAHVELEADDLDARLSETNSALNRLVGTVQSVQSTANNALDRANQASGQASNALTTGQKAITIAAIARTDAYTAQEKATQAQSTAAEAKTIAVNANGVAISANEKGDIAIEAGNQAINISHTALGAANKAQTSADYALDVAKGAAGIAGTAIALIPPLTSNISTVGGVAKEADRKATLALNRPAQVVTIEKTGIPGAQGKPGINGKNGIDGKNGTNGLPGINGLPGKDGESMTPEDRQQLINIGTGMAGLTLLVNNRLPQPLTPDNLANAAATGVCRTTKPGGCMANALNNNAANTNGNLNNGLNDLLNKLNAGANAAQLGLLNTINNKLGVQVIGGISGFLTNFKNGFDALAKRLGLDWIMSAITMVATLHNAYMISDSVRITLIQTFNDFYKVFGVKDENGHDLEIGSLYERTFDTIFTSIFGEGTLDGIKKEWTAFNRIYQASANIMFALQNIGFSILNAFNAVGSINTNIANALKKYGVVGHNAFPWFNPTPDFHNKFFTAISEKANEVVTIITSLDFIAQSILQGRQAIDDFAKQGEELDKKLKEEINTHTVPEHEPTKKAEEKSIVDSKSPKPSDIDLLKIED